MSAPWPAVKAAFAAFNKPLEAAAPQMYADSKCLVTTSIGCLIDNPDQAAALPFVDVTAGAWASEAQIRAEWQRIKDGCIPWSVTKTTSPLWLTDDGMRSLVETRLAQNVSYLASVFTDFGTWPADAQLALLSLAWAAGTSMAGWPNLTAALRARDFVAAAEHGMLDPTGNPGLVPRNERNRHLWLTAAAVEETGDDPSRLYGYEGGAVTLGGATPPGGSRPGDGASGAQVAAVAGLAAVAVALVRPDLAAPVVQVGRDVWSGLVGLVRKVLP